MASVGENRVRIQFNPSNSTPVSQFKQETAQLINNCEFYKEETTNTEAKRLWSLAQTAYEEAAMWAVKAATA